MPSKINQTWKSFDIRTAVTVAAVPWAFAEQLATNQPLDFIGIESVRGNLSPASTHNVSYQDLHESAESPGYPLSSGRRSAEGTPHVMFFLQSLTNIKLHDISIVNSGVSHSVVNSIWRSSFRLCLR